MVSILSENAPSETGKWRERVLESPKILMFLLLASLAFWIFIEILFAILWKNKEPLILFPLQGWVLFLLILVAVVVHELIHGIVFAIYAPNKYRAVSFGISKTMGSPYCHCSDPLKVKHYRRAGIAPFLLLGLLPLLFAMFTGIKWMKTFGLLLSVGGFGDLLIWIELLKYNGDLLVKDHPKKMGFIIEDIG